MSKQPGLGSLRVKQAAERNCCSSAERDRADRGFCHAFQISRTPIRALVRPCMPASGSAGPRRRPAGDGDGADAGREGSACCQPEASPSGAENICYNTKNSPHISCQNLTRPPRRLDRLRDTKDQIGLRGHSAVSSGRKKRH